MPVYRLYASEDGATHIEPLGTEDFSFENGPGEFKGVGGMVLGDASRVLLMRFEAGVQPSLHRANPGLAVLLEGELTVAASGSSEVALRPGDAIRVESTGRRGWAPRNPGESLALTAISQMPSGGRD
ncbi:MAG TPA: hypothetical protein QGI71_12520 [Dehalococcoidia bacterium]|nr:hypothetical protein [Dehalococcoidia bacterium]